MHRLAVIGLKLAVAGVVCRAWQILTQVGRVWRSWQGVVEVGSGVDFSAVGIG